MKLLIRTVVILLMASACGAGWAEAQVRDDAAGAPQVATQRCGTVAFSRCTPVGENKLAEIRGGYDVGGGLQVSFGITRATYVNGELVAQSQLSVRDLTARSAGPAATSATWSTTGPQAIQLGAGNSVRMDQLPLGAVVIQNSLNNQNIRNLTVIDASTNSLQLLRGINSLGALRDVLSLPSTAR